jgi:hypothetical protein
MKLLALAGQLTRKTKKLFSWLQNLMPEYKELITVHKLSHSHFACRKCRNFFKKLITGASMALRKTGEKINKTLQDPGFVPQVCNFRILLTFNRLKCKQLKCKYSYK